jgi:hypothetical protein
LSKFEGEYAIETKREKELDLGNFHALGALVIAPVSPQAICTVDT